MPLFNTIQRLQQASRRKREIILAITVLVVMAIIVIIWFVQLSHSLSSGTPSATSEAKTPMEAMWSMITDLF